MLFQKKTWLLVLFLLALVCAIAFHIIQISQTENLYPIVFSASKDRSGYGYVNQDAQLVVQPQFEYAGKFSEGFAAVRVNKKWGFINLQGQISISPQYDTVGQPSNPYSDDDDDHEWSSSSFSEGLAGVKLNRKWGFINQSGKLVIPYQYDKVQQFSGGVATVKVNGLWGVINPEGKWIIQPVDKSPVQFFQGIARLSDPNTHQFTSYWDKSGRLVGDFNNPPRLAKEFQEELAIIEIPSWAKQQKLDIPPVVTTSESQFFSSGRSKCGFQDKQGKVVIEPQFDGCRSFSSGLAAVGVEKKWGYIDKTGKFIVSPQFDYADRLFEERGLVVSNGKIGFIDKTGKVVIKPEFEPSLSKSYSGSYYTAESKQLKLKFKEYPEQLDLPSSEVTRHRFSHGLAAVGKDDQCGYIDKTGKFVIQPQFSGCEQFDSYGVAEVGQKLVGQKDLNELFNNKLFYINSQGKTFPQITTSALFSNFYPARIKLLTSVMACLLWIVAISYHEFGHAIVAYWGGDRSVKDKGYLSFNPRRYINPLHSIILPAIFLVAGGIPLPGAAVYIEFDQIRNRLWASATAAAGPIASIIFGLLLVPVFHFSIAWNFPDWFSAFIAIFINLQFIIALFNLLPIPPLDGYRIIAVWLPYKLQDRSGIASLIGLFFICFLLPFTRIADPLFNGSAAVMLALGISDEFSLGGWHLLEPWYMALPLLVGGVVYLIYKPASIFELANRVLKNLSPQAALKNSKLNTLWHDEKAIKVDPVENSTQLSQSWECIQTITNYGHSVVGQIAFSPDGRTLASSGEESGWVKLWDVASGEEIHTFSDDQFMAFSLDSKTLAGRRYFWDMATGRATSKIAENFDSHCKIAISPDFQTVASYQIGEQCKVTKLWERATGTEICTLPSLGTRTGYVADWHYRFTKFSPDGQIIAKLINYDDYPQELKLWEATTGREICTIAVKGSGGCFCFAFSPDGQILASAWKIFIGKKRCVILLSEVATGNNFVGSKLVVKSTTQKFTLLPSAQIVKF